jgi:DNA repair exonuclease SbcCD nuclease subunit
MTKILRIGDMHCQINNLEESHRILRYAIQLQKEHDIDAIEFLGDQFHNHAILRLEVLTFWEEWVRKLELAFKQVTFIVGNHDICGDKETELAMNSNLIFTQHARVVSQPIESKGILYCPYTSKNEQFLSWCQNSKAKTLICHQMFKDDTQFWTKDYIDAEILPFTKIICGHYHTQSHLGKVFYQGSPRWLTMDDCNQNKSIVLYEHAQDGSIVNTQEFDMDGICQKITSYIINEGDVIPTISKKDRNYIELRGSSSWANTIKKKLFGLGSIKIIPTDTVILSNEKKKVYSLSEYLEKSFQPIAGVSRQEIEEVLNA